MHERLKELVDFAGRQAAALVGDLDDRVPVALEATNVNGGAVPRELDGVLNQVRDRRRQQLGIGRELDALRVDGVIA